MAGNEIFRPKIKKEYEMGNGDYFQNYSEEEYCNFPRFRGRIDNRDGATQRDDDKKLFVGNLSWETSDGELRRHFGRYGQIESVNIKTNPKTGRSRGFAFVVFKTAESVDRVLTDSEHIIKNKRADPKKVTARYGKVFVGGLPWELCDSDIKDYFSQFGNVVEIEIPYDRVKQRRMGFCFITFDSEQPVDDLMGTPEHLINGKRVDVKKYNRGMRGCFRDEGGRERVGNFGIESGRENQEEQRGDPDCAGNYPDSKETKARDSRDAKRGRGKTFYKGKGDSRWQHQELRKMKLRLKLSVELDSE